MKTILALIMMASCCFAQTPVSDLPVPLPVPVQQQEVKKTDAEIIADLTRQIVEWKRYAEWSENEIAALKQKASAAVSAGNAEIYLIQQEQHKPAKPEDPKPQKPSSKQ